MRSQVSIYPVPATLGLRGTRTLLDLQQIRSGNERGFAYGRQEKFKDSYSLRDGAR
ncbi:MAG: hypothetical protein ACPK85_12725 [Methanosarcina sp.]